LVFAIVVAFEAATTLIKMAFRRDRAGDEATLEAAKRMVRGYLRGEIDWLG
jgi:hypothetical protein